MNGEVLIVDEHTGRILPGRRYNEGMHQAIEAKEGVAIKAENQTLATITLQNYFRLYGKLSGMTGTAETEAAEFQSTYELGVVPIPTNRGMQRIDQKDYVYKSEDGKFDAVVEDIVERHAKGQPVLVGTTSVEKSELLSSKLKKQGVPHEVLNAKQHEREAAIVAQAGRKGAVTVATNMAGRGTDIMLGGNAEFMAVSELAARGLDPAENAEEYEAAWPEALEKAKEAVAAEHDEVVELGGLYVLGTERHESRRIDNQLRGRSGRQGDPGESRFYLSMQDDLMRLFNSGLAESMMTRAGFPEDMPLESKIVTRGIQSAQSQVEARNFEIRKNVLKYDDVMSRQREVIYERAPPRARGRGPARAGRPLPRRRAHGLHPGGHGRGAPGGLGPGGAVDRAERRLPGLLTPDEVVDRGRRPDPAVRRPARARVLSDAEHAYAEREEQIGSDNMRQLERRVTLSVLDRKWREHLYEMDYLKEGIGLRAMAQRDPLVEYQREGYQLFNAMNDAIKEETVGYLFNLEVKVQEAEEAPVTAESPPPLPRPRGPQPSAWSPRASTARRSGCRCSTPRRLLTATGRVVTKGDGPGAVAKPAARRGWVDNREERRKAAKQSQARERRERPAHPSGAGLRRLSRTSVSRPRARSCAMSRDAPRGAERRRGPEPRRPRRHRPRTVGTTDVAPNRRTTGRGRPASRAGTRAVSARTCTVW